MSDKLETFTKKDADAQISQYTASGQKEITGLLEKDVFKVVTPEEFVTADKDVAPEEIPSDTQKGQAYNDKDKHLVLTQSLTIQRAYDVNQDFYIQPPCEQISLPGASSVCYHPHYKEKPGMTESAHDPFLFRPPPQLSSLPGDWSNCVVKFGTYHPHYKDKAVGDPTRTFVCAANCFYFLCYWSNLSAAFFLTHDSGAYTAEPGLVTKKGEPPRILSLFTTDTAMPSCSPSSTFVSFSPFPTSGFLFQLNTLQIRGYV